MTDSSNTQPSVQPEHRDNPIGRPRSVGLTILVSILSLGLWTWVWSYMNGEELRAYRGNQGLGGLAYLIITIIISPVTMFMMAYEVESMYRDEGEEPRITALWGLWFLLPLIGNLIWYIRIQNALNAFWQARGGAANPGVT